MKGHILLRSYPVEEEETGEEVDAALGVLR